MDKIRKRDYYIIRVFQLNLNSYVKPLNIDDWIKTGT